MAMIKRHVKAVIQFRRATEEQWIHCNPILREGEPALSIDVMKVKVGDGKTDWINLQYIDRNVSEDVIFIDSTHGLVGERNRLYINMHDLTALIWDGESFVELESSSIDGLKRRVTTNENDIADLRTQIVRGADKNYIHTQYVASDTWTIVHNLGKYPSITVVDSADTVVIGEIILQTTERAVISFSGAFSGKAYCN